MIESLLEARSRFLIDAPNRLLQGLDGLAQFGMLGLEIVTALGLLVVLLDGRQVDGAQAADLLGDLVEPGLPGRFGGVGVEPFLKTGDIVPEFLEQQARRVGVTRDALHQALRLNNDGEQVGVYREGSELIPIVMRSREDQRHDIDNLSAVNVWSEEQGRYLSAGNVLGELHTELRDPLIKRRDRRRMLAVYAEPMPLSGETAASVLSRLRPQVEAIELPPGYAIEWGGEYETASDAQKALLSSLPMGLLGMFIITVLLFGRLRQALAIWSIVPLMLIGIIGGLALLGAPFTFMALLGTLSLIGMVLKNAIVLMEEINVQRGQQDNAHDAVIQAAVSRVRPVTMAAVTTMLGMLPLFTDAFFASMAFAATISI